MPTMVTIDAHRKFGQWIRGSVVLHKIRHTSGETPCRLDPIQRFSVVELSAEHILERHIGLNTFRIGKGDL
jgi:hypothetical protein